MKLDKYTIGKRYGKALFDLAVEKKSLHEIHEDLIKLQTIVRDVPELPSILSDVRLDSNEKRLILNEMLKGFTGITANFIQVVFDYNRMGDLELMIQEFERKYDDYLGLVLGTVTTAVPLAEDQKKKIEINFAKAIGCQTAQLTPIIDPSILGGVVTEGNHLVVDGSVKTQLNQLQTMLEKI